MHLTQILTPTPDWPLILVYSDYLEDTGNLNQANALRWLYTWDHWPYSRPSHCTGWWIANSYTSSSMACSRYGRCSCSREASDTDLLQATLPPEYKLLSEYFASYSTPEEALLSFFDAYALVGDITPDIFTPSDYPDLPRSFASLVEGTRGE